MPATILAVLAVEASLSPCALTLCVRAAPPVERFKYFGFLAEWLTLAAVRRHVESCKQCKEVLQ